MASNKDFVAHAASRMAGAGAIRYRAMFGEYGIYCDDVFVAMVCDDQLFVKPTPEGRAFAGEIDEAPPYPGAKPALLIGDRMEDEAWLAELVRITKEALPPPKKKA